MQDVIIRQISRLDYDPLTAFLAAFPGDNRSQQQWQNRLKHWWDENPAFDENWVRGYVIEDNKCIVGFVGSFPSLLKYGGKTITAFNGSTWRVIEGYRNHSIDLWFKNREISNHNLSFNTTPTDSVTKMIKMIKNSLLPWGDCRESVYILNPIRFVKEKLSSKYGFCSYLLIPAIAFKQLFIRKSHQVYSFRKLNCAGSEFDELWGKTTHMFEFTNVRTSETVNWYSKGKLLIGIYFDNLLVGYIIFSQKVASKISEICLVDLWLMPDLDLNKVIPDLVSYAIKLGLSVDIDFIRFPHFTSTLAKAFRRTGLPGTKINRMNYFRIPDNWIGGVAENNSYFCLLQGDYDV